MSNESFRIWVLSIWNIATGVTAPPSVVLHKSKSIKSIKHISLHPHRNTHLPHKYARWRTKLSPWSQSRPLKSKRLVTVGMKNGELQTLTMNFGTSTLTLITNVVTTPSSVCQYNSKLHKIHFGCNQPDLNPTDHRTYIPELPGPGHHKHLRALIAPRRLPMSHPLSGWISVSGLTYPSRSRGLMYFGSVKKAQLGTSMQHAH